MADYNASILLDENKWKKLEVKEEAIEAEGELTRYIGNIPREHSQALLDVVKARRSETNPKADTITYSGVYRILEVSHKPEKNGAILYEKLALGFFTSIPEANARFLSYSVDPRDGTISMQRRFPYTDPKVVDTLLTTLASTSSYTDPEMDGETYSGKFAVKHSAQKERDGSISIVQALTKLVAVAGTNMVVGDLPDALVDHKRAELDPLSSSHGYVDEIKYTYRALDPAYKTDAQGFSKTDLAALITPDKTVNDDTTWTYSKHEIVEQDDNTMQLTLTGVAVLPIAYEDVPIAPVTRIVQRSDYLSTTEKEYKAQTATDTNSLLSGTGSMSWQRDPKTGRYNSRVRTQSARTVLDGDKTYILRSQRPVDRVVTSFAGKVLSITQLYTYETHTVTQYATMTLAIAGITGGEFRSSYWQRADGVYFGDKVSTEVKAKT